MSVGVSDQCEHLSASHDVDGEYPETICDSTLVDAYQLNGCWSGAWSGAGLEGLALLTGAALVWRLVECWPGAGLCWFCTWFSAGLVIVWC